ncbi:hypothetical protein EGY25_04410 [Brevundimonas intermedia]|uniref:Uncharacterized protein n=1 Tax=Brevundimonas intermedia TaxID=74315 RepID=A0A4Y9S1S7_9CAUL|nr:hypothetical protein [Brevundimonas intermedia]TFW14441.1 hypothetical protein EGY25_04410 [Brevundimonas intermedia]
MVSVSGRIVDDVIAQLRAASNFTDPERVAVSKHIVILDDRENLDGSLADLEGVKERFSERRCKGDSKTARPSRHDVDNPCPLEIVGNTDFRLIDVADRDVENSHPSDIQGGCRSEVLVTVEDAHRTPFDHGVHESLQDAEIGAKLSLRGVLLISKGVLSDPDGPRGEGDCQEQSDCAEHGQDDLQFREVGHAVGRHAHADLRLEVCNLSRLLLRCRGGLGLSTKRQAENSGRDQSFHKSLRRAVKHNPTLNANGVRIGAAA